MLFLLSACHSSKKVRTTTSVKEAANDLPAIPTTTPLRALTSNPNSLLWEISGNGLPQKSYLFGTIHLIEEKDFELSDVAKDRFSRTQELYLELDMDDPSILMQGFMGIMMDNGVTLKDLVNEDEYLTLERYFEDSVGMNLAMFETIKPILLSSFMEEQLATGKMISYESVFIEMAKEREMEVLGLETVEYQMSMFDSIPYEQQANMLLESINDKSDSSKDQFKEMIDLYLTQDIDALSKSITEEASELSNFETLLIINRNKNWIPIIAERSKKLPTFFAVGAGHLGGKEGVVNLLRDAGFTMTPLRDL